MQNFLARSAARLAALILATAAISDLCAQAPAAKRPKIGLVLSGGGARGTAHVGVLKVLEEMRIPVDFVVGTSMGSIVGGLYAYGHSPEELQRILTRADSADDWEYLLLDGSRRKDMSFRRKEDDRRFLTTLRIGVHDGALAFPKGLLIGQNLETELRMMTLEAHAMKSFDDLPLPFRCVAVDLLEGTQVILADGSLPDAMRASMSLPGVFAPARIRGRELLDGGLLNNVPIDIARQLGAEVVIVVDIATPLEKNAKLPDFFRVTAQMIAILTDQNMRQSRASLKPDDLWIAPDLGNITSADFERGVECIAAGEKAARSFAEPLRKFAVSQAEFDQFLQKQRRKAAPMPVLRNIQLTNDSGLSKDLIESRLDIFPGTQFDPIRARKSAERLYGTDDLERVSLSLSEWRDGEADLNVDVQEKSWGPSYVRFGLALESNFQGESAFNLSGQYNARVLDSLGAEWRTRLQVGRENIVDSEYYQPMDAGGLWFVAPRVFAENAPANVYQQNVRVADVNITYGGAGFDGGMHFGNWGELRMGLEGVYGDVDIDGPNVPVQGGTFQDTRARIKMQVDTLDNPVFPHAGILAGAQWRAGLPDLGADVGYQQVSLRWVQGIAITHDTAIIPRAQFTTEIDASEPIYVQPSLGGFLQLSGLDPESLRGVNSGLVSLILDHRMSGTNASFTFPMHVGGSIEGGNTWNNDKWFGGSYTLAGSVFVGVDTPIGPTFLAYGQAEGGARSVYFFLGPVLGNNQN